MELYHALNRGVEGRDIFMDSQDYARFVHNLYEFNDTAPAGNAYRLFNPSGMMDLVGPSFREKRNEIVDIHGWCLMKNHFHLLLSERVEGGMTKFLMKVNVGYAKYFNERYKRQGSLFQGRTKKVLVEREAQALYILHYIHLNPLDYLSQAEQWRLRDKGGIQDVQEALRYLQEYRWSSYLDYCGTKNFPSLLTGSLYEKENYIAELAEYLTDSEYPPRNLTLE